MNQLDENINTQQLTKSLRSSIKNLIPFCIQYPENQPQQINVQNLIFFIQQLTSQLSQYFANFQKHMQTMEDTVRKHVKNQIQLKLYYEHLQQVIQQLKNQQRNSQFIIQNLKIQNQKFRQKQKPVPTSNNTKDDTNNGVVHTSGFQSKLDTITKIKNRLSLNNTGEFYARNMGYKVQKDPYVKQLHSKRQSLASTLQKLYQTQTLKKQSKSKSQKSLKRSKSKKSQNKSQTKLMKSKKSSPRLGKKQINKTYNSLSSRKNSHV